MDLKNIKKISNDELEHYLFTPDGIGKIGKKMVFDELLKRSNIVHVHDVDEFYKEETP